MKKLSKKDKKVVLSKILPPIWKDGFLISFNAIKNFRSFKKKLRC
ncbi:MAG: hypothetical protein ACOCRK_04665 [bacterium]